MRTKQSHPMGKPKALGRHDVADPPMWSVRRDRFGNWYYHNRMNQDITSWEKPKGYLPCEECGVFFAERRCKQCTIQKGGRDRPRYCYDCFETVHTRSPALWDHEFDKIAVRPAICHVCSKQMARIVCTDCAKEPYCGRCFETTHAKGKRAKHKFENI